MAKDCWCGGRCPHVARALELEKQKRPRLAELELHSRLIDAPDCERAHSLLARILGNENRAHFALEHVDRAIAAGGRKPALVMQKAFMLRNAVKLKDAIEAARESVALELENPDAYAQLILCLYADGQNDEALELVKDCDWRFANTHHRGISIRRIAAVVEAESGDLEKALKRLSADDLIPLELFDRGRFKEKLRDYPGAWSDWQRGKEMMRAQGNVYDPAAHERLHAELIEFCRPARARRFAIACDMPPRPWPLFITGFPRSGTTMVEAVLACHPDIAPGDELAFLTETIQRIPQFLRVLDAYPRALAAFEHAENVVFPSLLRDFYCRKAIAKIGASARDKRYFTDKMPSNEKHWPLISMLFPETPILHLRRHPLDVIVSNMSHSLTHNGFVGCALEWIAHNMALLDEMMEIYRENNWARNVHEVRYEHFVTNHRFEIDRMLPNDLPSHPALHDFHLGSWHSRTISHRQIKAPVNAGSVGRWEPFREFLKPVFSTIDRILGRAGYQR